jgi:sugar (pentulose or hexulose) kinase
MLAATRDRGPPYVCRARLIVRSPPVYKALWQPPTARESWMDRDHILAIDSGTQSVRALVFDPGGNLVAGRRVPYEPYVSPSPGWAEQDPRLYWQALCKACQALWKEKGVHRERLAGVALTSQRATLVNVDRSGEPLRPAIVWLDTRRTEGLKPFGGFWGLVIRLAGLAETVAYMRAEAEANWIAVHQPEIWARTYKFLFLSGYLTYRLTGRFVDSVGCQVGYVPFDYKAQRWISEGSWRWGFSPIRPDMLPELVRPAEPLGEISEAASKESGIPAGLPLIAAAADKACEVLGCGCLEPHLGCLSFGTTATLNTTHRRYREVIRLFPPYPAALPGAYSLEVPVLRGFWMVRWFKEEFGFREQILARERGVEPELLLDELVGTVPAGAQGLVLLPYWSPGVRFPGPEARGAIIGFSDVHTRAHLYRAVLEGIVHALRDGAEKMERKTGVSLRELRVAGGGSQSDAAMQITADLFGLPASRPHLYEASALGAAIDAAVGLGLHPDFETAIRRMTRLGRTFEPDPGRHELYTEIHQQVYLKLYGRLKPLYEALRGIGLTGRPE